MKIKTYFSKMKKENILLILSILFVTVLFARIGKGFDYSTILIETFLGVLPITLLWFTVCGLIVLNTLVDLKKS